MIESNRYRALVGSGDLGFDDAQIAKCLDHAVTKKGDAMMPTVKGKVNNHSKRTKEKRAALHDAALGLQRNKRSESH